MPFPGEVYRQTQCPILWVKDIHALDRLYVRDLRSDPAPPVRQTPVDPDAQPRSDLDDSQSVQGDSDDEDKIGEETTVDGREAIGMEDFFDGGFGGDEGFVGPCLDGEDGPDGDEDEDEAERMAKFMELQDQGDAKKERLEIETQRLQRALDAMKDALTYPSTHPHLHEVPETAEGWLTQSERLERTRNQRSLPTTFGSNRRGNVFVQL
jgi:hypothetical protein